MDTPVVQQFLSALSKLETDSDVEPMAALFHEQSEIGNVLSPDKYHGQSGAREFWTKYRETFDSIRSSFQHQIVADGQAALEWTTEATTTGGTPVRYSGVSVLDSEGDRIRRFQAYFDPHALGKQVQSGAKD